MLAKAVERGLVSIDVTDIRDYSHDPHHTADDYQFGGGHGMVLKPEPVFEATEAALSGYSDAERKEIPIILFTPQGEMLTQKVVEELSQAPAVAMICDSLTTRQRSSSLSAALGVSRWLATGCTTASSTWTARR